MAVRKMSSESFFRMLLILFGAMLMSQVTLVGTFLYLAFTGEMPPPDPELIQVFAYVVPAVACVCFGLSFVFPVKLINNAANKPSLSGKLRGYQAATIIKIALFEAPAVLGCVAYYLTGEYYWLIVNLVSLLLFATAFPTKEKVIDCLHLSGQEVELLNDPKAIVMEYEVTND
jgi:hypothetical protein